jgi:hypothetical protein
VETGITFLKERNFVNIVRCFCFFLSTNFRIKNNFYKPRARIVASPTPSTGDSLTESVTSTSTPKRVSSPSPKNSTSSVKASFTKSSSSRATPATSRKKRALSSPFASPGSGLKRNLSAARRVKARTNSPSRRSPNPPRRPPPASTSLPPSSNPGPTRSKFLNRPSPEVPF